jgi:hypothetical protein
VTPPRRRADRVTIESRDLDAAPATRPGTLPCSHALSRRHSGLTVPPETPLNASECRVDLAINAVTSFRCASCLALAGLRNHGHTREGCGGSNGIRSGSATLGCQCSRSARSSPSTSGSSLTPSERSTAATATIHRGSATEHIVSGPKPISRNRSRLGSPHPTRPSNVSQGSEMHGAARGPRSRMTTTTSPRPGPAEFRLSPELPRRSRKGTPRLMVISNPTGRCDSGRPRGRPKSPRPRDLATARRNGVERPTARRGGKALKGTLIQDRRSNTRTQ